MYTACLVVGLIFITFGLLAFVLFLIIYSDSGELKHIGISIMGGIMVLLGGLGISVYCRHDNSTEIQYQKLLTNVDEANKELQKFYIDHPEYKLEEKEND